MITPPRTYNRKPMSTSNDPARLPFIARTLMPREVSANATMAVALGALEGGLIGVIVKTQFDGVAAPMWVNLCVALVAGAPAFANIASLWISSLAEGRDRTSWVAGLKALTAFFLLVMAIVPISAGGLLLLTVAMLASRLSWAGVITLRAAIWRANFPRHVRGQITGRITVIYSLIIALTAAAIGGLMSWWPEAWRAVFPVAGLLGLVAAARYRRVRIRRGNQLRRQELSQ